MDKPNAEFKAIDYVRCAGYLATFPSRVPIFYFNGDQLNQIKTPDEFITVVSKNLTVYIQI